MEGMALHSIENAISMVDYSGSRRQDTSIIRVDGHHKSFYEVAFKSPNRAGTELYSMGRSLDGGHQIRAPTFRLVGSRSPRQPVLSVRIRTNE